MSRRAIYPFFAITATLLLAALTRILHLDSQSLWIDEGFTWFLTQTPDPLEMLIFDVHPPLYFTLFAAWVQLAGDSVLAMRFLSVMPSLISIALMAPLARELERQRGINSGGLLPVLACLMLALADMENFLAQEARSYTLQTMFICASMLGFLRWGRKGGRAALALWALSLIALLYTFYLAAAIGVVQGLYALLFLRGRRRVQAIGVLILCAVALLPWLAFTLGEQSGNLSYAYWVRLNDFVLRDIRRIWFSDQWALMMAIALMGLVVFRYAPGREAGEARVSLRWRPLGPALLPLMWFALPLLLTLIANEIVPLYSPRRVAMITPGVALLVAFGLLNLRRPLRPILIAVILVYGISSTDYYEYKQPWQDMVEMTQPYIAPDDLVLIELGGDDYAPVYHYRRALPESNSVRGLTTWRRLEPETYESALPTLIAEHETVWLFYWSKDFSAMPWLDTLGYQRSATFTVDFNPDVYFYRYDRIVAEPLARYENGLILQAAEVRDAGLIELWWTRSDPFDESYTTSGFLLDEAGQLVAQFDSQPFFNEQPMPTWPQEALIYDPKPLITLSGEPLPPGRYQAGVVVYRQDQAGLQRLNTEAGEDMVLLGTIVQP